MSDLLRPITPADHAAVLAWNAEHVELLAPLEQARLDQLLAWGQGHLIHENGADVGFVLTFPAGASYDSANFAWFSARHDAFLYLDRVVVDPSVRRTGTGTRVYDELEEQARALGPVMCLEVNLDPPNEPSLAFHASRGYQEVGRREADDGHLLLMLEKYL